jgi:hemoglobin-like flavoprotein
MVLKAATGVARESYDRCCKAPEFLDAFYKNFLAACPEAKAMFARTNFTQQTKLLRHAIGLLLIFPNHPSAEPTLLTRLAERHSRRDLDVDPALYGPFIDALIATVQQFDPECSPAVEAAWRETVGPGVDYMKKNH